MPTEILNENPQIIDLRPYQEPETISMKKIIGTILLAAALILLVISCIPYITYAYEQIQGENGTSKNLPSTATRLFGARNPRTAGAQSVTSQPSSSDLQFGAQLPLTEQEYRDAATNLQPNDKIGHLYVNGSEVNVNAPIVEGVEDENLVYGVGHQPGTAIPNPLFGNVSIAGHRWLPSGNEYSKIFIDLPNIKIGETIDLEYKGNTYTYEVYNTEIVKPQDVYILDETDKPELTIYTCHPWNSSSSRFVVFSKLISIQ